MNKTATASRPTGSRPVVETDLQLSGFRRGKVRDLYEVPPARPGEPGRLLLVASDRISAFDVVLPTPIPGKGRLLTAVSVFWLRWVESQGLCRTHLLSDAVADLPDSAFKAGGTSRADLSGRIMMCRQCKVLPVECVVRGYLEGSGWRDYQRTGAVSGIRLPAGLRQCDRLPEPLFTPSTKAEPPAHDEAISFERGCEIVGARLMTLLRDKSLSIYVAAAEYARQRGIIIADTKFEFGLPVDAQGEPTGADPLLIDEVLTPDSSRFWPADDYKPGRSQPSFDKQYVREYLQSLVDAGKWNKESPGPELPTEVVENTARKYAEVIERLQR